jgi:hypothetical protein
MLRTRGEGAHVAAARRPVLVCGESGVGTRRRSRAAWPPTCPVPAGACSKRVRPQLNAGMSFVGMLEKRWLELLLCGEGNLVRLGAPAAQGRHGRAGCLVHQPAASGRAARAVCPIDRVTRTPRLMRQSGSSRRAVPRTWGRRARPLQDTRPPARRAARIGPDKTVLGRYRDRGRSGGATGGAGGDGGGQGAQGGGGGSWGGARGGTGGCAYGRGGSEGWGGGGPWPVVRVSLCESGCCWVGSGDCEAVCGVLVGGLRGERG